MQKQHKEALVLFNIVMEMDPKKGGRKKLIKEIESTITAEQGDKGKKLTFAGTIPFKSVSTLTKLYQFASAKDENNDRQVYRIGNDLAQALKIRSAKFTGNINAIEHASLLAWTVSFELRECNGVAEQKENRRKQQTKADQVQNTRHQQALRNAEEVGL